MSNEIQLWSDFSQFGVHLVPITLTKTYGLGDKIGLLLLIYDPQGRITHTHQRANLTVLWQKGDRSVYIVPVAENNAFLPASELLHRLGLSMVAPPNTLSSKQLLNSFINLMGDDYVAFYQLLYGSQFIGKNHLGESVFSSNLGRYTIGKEPHRYQLTSSEKTADARLLFGVNPLGEIEDIHLINCMKAFLLSDHARLKRSLSDYIYIVSHIPVETNEMQGFLELSNTIINKLHPKKITSPLFEISCYQALYNACAYVLYDFIHDKKLTIALLRKLIQDFQTIERILPARKNSSIETPFVSMPLAVILAFLVNPNQDDITIFSDSIADLTILAAIKKCIVVETRSNLFQQIKIFKEQHNTIGIDEYDSNKHGKRYKYNVGIYPQGLNYVEVVIPFLNQENKIFLDAYTDRYAISRVIHSLNNRDNNGRSVYLVGGEPVGVLGENYMFYAWLQAYFHNVTITDLSGDIFPFDNELRTMRMIIVGETKSPRPENKEKLAQATQHIHANTVIEVKTDLDMLVSFCEAIITKDLSKNYLIQNFEDGEVEDNETVGLFKTYKIHASKFKKTLPSTVIDTKVNNRNPVNPFANLDDTATPFINLDKNEITLAYFDELLESAAKAAETTAEAEASPSETAVENKAEDATTPVDPQDNSDIKTSESAEQTDINEDNASKQDKTDTDTAPSEPVEVELKSMPIIVKDMEQDLSDILSGGDGSEDSESNDKAQVNNDNKAEDDDTATVVANEPTNDSVQANENKDEQGDESAGDKQALVKTQTDTDNKAEDDDTATVVTNEPTNDSVQANENKDEQGDDTKSSSNPEDDETTGGRSDNEVGDEDDGDEDEDEDDEDEDDDSDPTQIGENEFDFDSLRGLKVDTEMDLDELVDHNTHIITDISDIDLNNYTD